ncbi:MAG: DNA methyltransferase [Desulfuromonas sp.]|nr:DNA methyltransferase [Desulfuromonas sp.]
MTALELFCGIGGFAAAAEAMNVKIVGALDQSPAALAVYRLNFSEHNSRQTDLEKITAAELAGFAADLWWLSPPCQPYSVRGHGLDLADPRARSLARLLEVFPQIPEKGLPRYLALENVAGFARSRARERLVDLLVSRKYEVRERLLCPTELGVPSRRPRYYLVASCCGLAPARPVVSCPHSLGSYLDPALSENPPPELLVPTEVVTRFGEGFRLLDPADPFAYTTCFTAGYGKSLMHAGSYLRCRNGERRFAPHEIARLLGFPETFRFPEELPLRKRWHLLGNSLSVVAVRDVLEELPGVNNGRRSSSSEI